MDCLKLRSHHSKILRVDAMIVTRSKWPVFAIFHGEIGVDSHCPREQTQWKVHLETL